MYTWKVRLLQRILKNSVSNFWTACIFFLLDVDILNAAWYNI